MEKIIEKFIIKMEHIDKKTNIFRGKSVDEWI